MAVYRGQHSALVTGSVLICLLVLSILVGLEYTSHVNARRKEEKFVAYSEEVREVNALMENLEARFEITSLEIQALRNRSLRMASTLRRYADSQR